MVSDLSFNPLTYMMDRQNDAELSMEALTVQEADDEQQRETRRGSVGALVGRQEDSDLTSLTGTLKFVKQTLAMQEDPSVWSSDLTCPSTPLS